MSDHDLFDKNFDLDNFNDDTHQTFRLRKKKTHRRRVILIFVGLNLLSMLTLSFILTNGQIFNYIGYCVRGGSKQVTTNSNVGVKNHYPPVPAPKKLENTPPPKPLKKIRSGDAPDPENLRPMTGIQKVEFNDAMAAQKYARALFENPEKSRFQFVKYDEMKSNWFIAKFANELERGKDFFALFDGRYIYISFDHQRVYEVNFVGSQPMKMEGKIYQDADGTWKNY